jgi:hypothetical protein
MRGMVGHYAGSPCEFGQLTRPFKSNGKPSDKCNVNHRKASRNLPGLILLSAWARASGCSGSAAVKVAFDHQAPSPQALTISDGLTPSVFGAKIVAVYVVEDIDGGMNNLGQVGRIWTNPACDAELHSCSISPEAGAYQVKDYFDLALPTEEVNARLNSQAQEIKDGTYRYVKLDMAGVLKAEKLAGRNDPSVHNLRFGMDTDTHEVRGNSNNVTIRLETPMVLADGDSVTVSLAYSLANAYFNQPDLNVGTAPGNGSLNDWICTDPNHVPSGPCLYFQGFRPSVSRTAAPAQK